MYRLCNMHVLHLWFRSNTSCVRLAFVVAILIIYFITFETAPCDTVKCSWGDFLYWWQFQIDNFITLQNITSILLYSVHVPCMCWRLLQLFWSSIWLVSWDSATAGRQPSTTCSSLSPISRHCLAPFWPTVTSASTGISPVLTVQWKQHPLGLSISVDSSAVLYDECVNKTNTEQSRVIIGNSLSINCVCEHVHC